MFWKLVRWGGTIILIAVAIIAIVLSDNKEETQQPVAPVQSSGSNFNL